jgi:hypothetical protein
MKYSLTLVLLWTTVKPLFSQTTDSANTRKTDSAGKQLVVLPWFIERFKLSGGAFYVVNKSNFRVEGTAEGTDIDMEKDLGLNRDVTTLFADLQWRISRRSHVGFNYYNIYRSANHTLQKDIIFEDTTYPINTNVYSYLNTNIYQFSYGYSIFSKPNFEAGVFVGTHVLNTRTGISAVNNSMGVHKETSYGFTAPLPDFGLWGNWAASKRIGLAANFSYFALTMNSTSGRLTAFSLNMIYKVVEQLDLSLGYSGLDFKVDVIKNDISGFLKWGYNGPLFTVNYSFGKKSWTH